MRRPFIPVTSVLLVALSLAGCSGGANPVRDMAVAAGVTGGEPRPAPDFVARTRPDQIDYLPVGQSAPRRSRAKDKQEVESAEAEMNRLSRANEARAAAAKRAGSSQ